MTPFPFDNNSLYVQIFFLVMSGLMLVCFFWYVLFIKIRRWDKTKGVIIKNVWRKSKVDEEVSGSVDIQYEYAVNGKKYKNNKVGIKDSVFPLSFVGQNPRLARKVYIRSSSNKEVWVYYDRKKPDVSCLDIGMDKGFLAFMFLCSLAFMIFAWY